MRVFAALRPAPAALEHLDSALASVRCGDGTGLRLVDPEQRHLTLAFRADLPEGALPETLDRLAAVAACHEPLTLHLSGAGAFRGRTLWIGVGGETGALSSLLDEDLLEERGRERRRAHLTVARVSARAPRAPRRRRRDRTPPPDPTRRRLDDAVRALSVYRGPSWPAEEIELVSSRLGEGRGGGPRHEVLASVPLGG
ncbi:RNA 2',3'-cyclic phosphodiesterase [Brachybacterium sp. AOP43-C2-M15]|uniref:RNA 2',3'-cyclic phosphodiesterase n=1 Tax=Brachybacterium sp. AOP43-C2-M15 TaxID=3457661 RepID=UPI004034BB76